MTRYFELEGDHARAEQVEHGVVVAFAKDHLVRVEVNLLRKGGQPVSVLGAEIDDEGMGLEVVQQTLGHSSYSCCGHPSWRRKAAESLPDGRRAKDGFWARRRP